MSTGSGYTLTIPENLRTDTFERMLRRFNRERAKKDAREITINLKAVSSCDPSALCSVVLLAHELATTGSIVHVALPNVSSRELPAEPNQQSFRNEGLEFTVFLVQSRFIDVLDELGITHDQIDTSAPSMRPKQEHALISPFLQFSKWANLNSFLKALRLSPQFDLFFKEASQFDVVTNGKIRDVILRELGDNIFEHAEGNFGLMVMNKSIAYRSSAAHWEEPFFRKWQGKPYLEVIIADRGPGIPATLSKAYRLDNHVVKPAKPTPGDVLEYAFLQYTTRKTLDERLKELLTVLTSTEQMDVIPATGLYWVKETCREFQAFLSVRSKNCLLVYDFLTNPNQGRPHKVEVIGTGKSSYKLQDFPGVQIKICFPTLTPRRLSQREINFAASPRKSRPHYLITLLQFLKDKKLDELDGQAAAILQVIAEIQKTKLSRPEPKVIIVDFDDVYLSNKGLFILGVELMRMQDSETTIATINADKINILDNEFSKFCLGQGAQAFGLPKERVLASFNSDMSLRLLGLDSATETAIQDFVSQPIEIQNAQLTTLDPLLLDSVKHLVQVLDPLEGYRFTFNFPLVKKRAFESMSALLKEVLTSSETRNRVFHPNQWFLIPSEAYCFGFFEVGRLIAKPETKMKLTRWLKAQLTDLKPDILIIVGSHEGVAALLDGETTFHQIIIDDPDKPSAWPRLTLLEQGTRVVILIDVLGTGTTLRKVIDKLPAVDVCMILTIIDARENEPSSTREIKFEGKQYPIESLIRFPIKFEWTLPDGCTYEDIVLIDPISHIPLWPVEKEAPIWADFNQFLDTVVRQTNSIAIGHFESNTKHILYFFLTPLIVEEYGPEIVERIRQNLVLTYSQMKKSPAIDTVFYPDKSPGSDRIAEKLCAIPEFLGSVALPLTTKMLTNPVSYPWSQDYELNDAIIFDDASSSGTTIERMIDIVESWGAKRIFVYVLFNRCDEYQTRLLKKRKGHGRAEVEVRFLTHVRIPAYTRSSCPVCFTIQELEDALTRVHNDQGLSQFITARISQLKVQPISLLEKQSTRSIFLSQDINRRLARCKLRRTLQAALSEPGPRNELATVIRSGEKKDALLFFQILAKEKQAFSPAATSLKELFYPTFRRELLRSAKRVYSKPLDISPKELDATITVSRIFDEDIFLADLDLLIRNTLKSDPHFYVVITNLLTSNQAKRQPSLISDLISKYRDQLPTEQLALFNDLESATRSTIASTADLFKKSLIALHPSAGPGLQFEFLRYEIDAYLSQETTLQQVVAFLRKNWEELSRRVAEEIVPGLKALVDSFKTNRLAPTVIRKLQERISEVESYMQACNDTYQDLLRETETDAAIDLAEQFQTYIVSLQGLLCSDEDETVHTALSGMVAEIRRTVKSTVDMQELRTIVKFYAIDCEIVVPDEACYVFGHQLDLVPAVANLVENLEHAFKNHASNDRRARIEITKHSNRIRFTVRDNGTANFPVTAHLGLQQVDSIISSFGGQYFAPRPAEDSVYKTEVGFELTAIAEDVIS